MAFSLDVPGQVDRFRLYNLLHFEFTDWTIFYILNSQMQIRTQNNVLALNFSFPQPHSSVGRRFAAWRSYFDSSYFATEQLAFSTKRHSMKHFGNWISLRIRVRSDDMQPCCDCVYIIPYDNLMCRLDNGFCICVAVCCSVLQRIAVCCSMYISYLVTTWRAGETMASVSVLQCVAVCCSVLQCVEVRT